MDKSPEAFRTISEVADWLGTPAHVLRFWESKFSQVKPIKRAGGRRYYRPSDMALLGGLKKLLHEDGMSIKGAQALIREQGVKHVAAMSPPLDDHAAPDADVIELTAEVSPEVPPEKPRPISGLPPLMLRTTAEEPEEVEATEEEHEREPELPFLHRRVEEHPTQPNREPLLRAAPEALDAHAAAPADETPPPGPEPLTLPRLAELRAAALAGGLGDELRARLLERLGELRDRMSEHRAF